MAHTTVERDNKHRQQVALRAAYPAPIELASVGGRLIRQPTMDANHNSQLEGAARTHETNRIGRRTDVRSEGRSSRVTTSSGASASVPRGPTRPGPHPIPLHAHCDRPAPSTPSHSLAHTHTSKRQRAALVPAGHRPVSSRLRSATLSEEQKKSGFTPDN